MNEVVTNDLPALARPDSLKKFSKELKDFIVTQKLYTNIVGKNYVNVEGWQFAGMSMGLVATVVSCDRLDRAEEIAYKAVVEVLSGERVVSRAFTICSNKESKKKSFDEYAIASMAQTRALGKAYRMLLGPLMKMAGYEGTPSEEMDEQYAEKEQRGTDTKAFCVDCGNEMAIYVKGDKKGQFHCKLKNAVPGEKPLCPPRKLTEWEEKTMKELDETPAPESLAHKKDCDCEKCIPIVNLDEDVSEQLKKVPF